MAFGLNAADEESVARTVLFAHMSTMGDRPYALLELSRLASSAGMYDISISAAERLLGPLLSSERLQTPFAIEQLAYPAPYAQDILEAAEAEGIPPLLLAALVRRESNFRADAVSSAGARGLTQVMPATGEAIADSLGVAWDLQMLVEPATSLRFGAHYLAIQLESFDDDVFGALAAYNGGPGNASRWYQEQAQPGADWYIETVDFAETRSYLRVVIEDYAWYRYVYGHASSPVMR
jgi:soluble lytic murein transglycosylase